MWTLLSGHHHGDTEVETDHQHPPLLPSHVVAAEDASAGSVAPQSGLGLVMGLGLAALAAGSTEESSAALGAAGASAEDVYDWWHTRALFHRYLVTLVCNGECVHSGAGPGSLGPGACDPALVTELLELSLLLATEMAQGEDVCRLPHHHTRGTSPMASIRNARVSNPVRPIERTRSDSRSHVHARAHTH